MAPRLSPRVVMVEESCEGIALVAELCATFAKVWEAAQIVGQPEVLAEARELAADLAEVKRHARRVAALSEVA